MSNTDWHVYVIHSHEKLTYIGMTKDLKRRLDEHNSGMSKWTRRGTNWRLVYWEKYNSAMEARTRERYFKNTAGREWLKRRGYL